MVNDFEMAALTPTDVKFNEQGLVPCIVQDADTKDVLMMAWMNAESLGLTIEQRTTWFYSRSRQKLWHKGEESGNTQELVALRYDCDADTLLALVRPVGPACHTGNYSCFYREFELPAASTKGEFEQDKPELTIYGLTKTLGITEVEASPQRAVGRMPVTPGILQPAGFVHGGATISLLESVASWTSWLGTDHASELSFGSHIDIRHVSAARAGYLYGTSELDHVEDLGERGRKEYWHVEAHDEAGRLISTGTITTRVVSKDFFASKNA